jgi:two-component system, sensor histidine kinase and response regulator
MIPAQNRRILLVDDNPAIHEDFKKILASPAPASAALNDAKAAFFGTPSPSTPTQAFELDSAHQGEQALAMVKAAIAEGRPYALAFVDVRMPPGWDGIETIVRLWEVDAQLQAVVCTAFSDYSWDEMIAKVGRTDRLLILKKPFDPVEVQQIASALTEKWNVAAREKARFDEARAAEREAKAYAASLVTMNRALETARAGAVAAAQAKSEFLANMSHEIRTPMIAILGHADLMSEAGLSVEERGEHLVTIREHGEHLLAMLSDILDISAIETGRLACVKAPCSVRAVLDDIRARFGDRARAKGLAFEIQCADSVPPSILSDATRLRQVLQHIVANAVKFTDAGSIRISVVPERDHGGDARRLEFAVQDTGVGITHEQRSRLFEAFAQVDGSLTRKHGGAGLGLVLSRRLAQLVGGDLDVESEAGHGSRFTLSLPFEEDVAHDAPSISTSSAARGGAQQLHGRILLAEDVAATQRLYALYLRRAGAEVDLADNGAVAIERVEASMREGRPYDVILMDMQMPVLDGYSATRALRQKGYAGPIIAVTAHALDGDRQRCIEAGCDDYCAKPAEREVLVGLSRDWIQRGVAPALPRQNESESTAKK